jgi:hypothetical protein
MLDLPTAYLLRLEELRRINRWRHDAGVRVAFASPAEALAAAQAEYALLLSAVRTGDDTGVLAAALRLAAVALKAAADLGRPEQRDAVGRVSDRLAAQGKGYAVSTRLARKGAGRRGRTPAESSKVRKLVPC